METLQESCGHSIRDIVKNRIISTESLQSFDSNIVFARKKFTPMTSPLKDDGYLTDDASEEIDSQIRLGAQYRRILRYVDRLKNVNTNKLDAQLLRIVFKIRFTLGEDRCKWYNNALYPSFCQRWRDIAKDENNDEKAKIANKEATIREGTWLMCAMVIYETLNYIQQIEKDGHIFCSRVYTSRYSFDRESCILRIWDCLNEGRQMMDTYKVIDAGFFRKIVREWGSGKPLAYSISTVDQ
jgi:hypothetical protein